MPNRYVVVDFNDDAKHNASELRENVNPPVFECRVPPERGNT